MDLGYAPGKRGGYERPAWLREAWLLKCPDLRGCPDLQGQLINKRQARAFGAHHHRVVFEWKLPMGGQAAGWLNDEEKEELYRHEPGMWGRFVHGAPAVINHNVGTDRGLVNGAAR